MVGGVVNPGRLEVQALVNPKRTLNPRLLAPDAGRLHLMIARHAQLETQSATSALSVDTFKLTVALQ